MGGFVEVFDRVRQLREVADLAWSSERGEIVALSKDGHLDTWSATSGEPRRRVSSPLDQAGISLLAADASALVVTDKRERLVFQDLEAGSEPVDLELGSTMRMVSALAIAARGAALAVGFNSGDICAWRRTPPEEFTKRGGDCFKFADREVEVLALSQEGKWLAAGSRGTLRIWNLKNRSEEFLWNTESQSSEDYLPTVLAVGPGPRVFVGHTNGSVDIWETGSETPIVQFGGHTSKILSIELSATGDQVLTSSKAGGLLLWNANSKVSKTIARRAYPIEVSALHPGKSQALWASSEGEILITDLTTAKDILVLGGQVARIEAHALDSTGNILASISQDRKVSLVDLVEMTERTRFSVADSYSKKPPAIKSLAVAREGSAIALGLVGGHVQVWPLEADSQTPGRFSQYKASGDPGALAFDSTGEHLFVTGEKFVDKLRLRPSPPGPTLSVPLDRPGTEGIALVVSPDGSRLAVGTAGGFVRILDTESLREMASKAFRSRLGSLAWPEQGEVSALSPEGQMSTWDLETDQRASWRRVSGDLDSEGGTISVAFSPNGQRFTSHRRRSGMLQVWQKHKGGYEPWLRTVSDGQENWAVCREDGFCLRSEDGSLLTAVDSSQGVRSLPPRRAQQPRLRLENQSPEVVEIAAGESVPVTVEVENEGPGIAYWLQLRLTQEIEGDLTFRGSPKWLRLEPGSSAELKGEISVGWSQSPTDALRLLLEVSEADSDSLALEPIPIRVKAPQPEVVNVQRNQETSQIVFTLTNSGSLSLPKTFLSVVPRETAAFSRGSRAEAERLGPGVALTFTMDLPNVNRLMHHQLELEVHGAGHPFQSWKLPLSVGRSVPWVLLTGLLLVLVFFCSVWLFGIEILWFWK